MNVVSTAYTIQEYTTLNSELAADWRALWQASPHGHFFNSPEWYETCVDVDDAKRFLILTAQQGDALVAVLPLVRERRYGIRMVRSPGGDLLDRSTMLYADGEAAAARALVAYVAGSAPVYLTEVPEDLCRGLADQGHASDENRAGHRIAGREMIIAPSSITIYGPTSEDPLQLMSSDSKKLERTLRTNAADVRFEYVNMSDPGRLDMMIAIERDSFKMRDGHSLFTNPHTRELFRRLMIRAGSACKVGFVWYKDQVIAHGMGLESKGTFFTYHTAYRKEYASLMPGKILTYHLMKTVHAAGMQTIDFSRGENALKRQFASSSMQQYAIYVARSRAVRRYVRTVLALKQTPLYTMLKRARGYMRRFASFAHR